LLWILIVVGSAAGAVAFGLLSYWIAFILFAVATLLAIAQLVRIRLRKPVQGGGGQRW
jgi:membrane protein implicated in regulation of membrane protease activity